MLGSRTQGTHVGKKVENSTNADGLWVTMVRVHGCCNWHSIVSSRCSSAVSRTLISPHVDVVCTVHVARTHERQKTCSQRSVQSPACAQTCKKPTFRGCLVETVNPIKYFDPLKFKEPGTGNKLCGYMIAKFRQMRK